MAEGADGPAEPSSVAVRTARRALADRESAYAAEVQRLLDAGLSLMVELGDREPRVADIVGRAGLSNQAFYRHFSGKDELIAAIVEAGVHRLETYLRHQLGKTDDPARKVRAWIVGVLGQATQPAVASQTRAAMDNLGQVPFEVRRSVSSPAIEAMLSEAFADLGSPDPVRDAAFVYSATFGRLREFLRRPPTDDDVEQIVAFALAGARR